MHFQQRSLTRKSLLDDGGTFAPKAVFGLAITEALAFSVRPKHFPRGNGSESYQILRQAGYKVRPRDQRNAEASATVSQKASKLSDLTVF
jgi:hypothetical protein